jgi:hypothetical protein
MKVKRHKIMGGLAVAVASLAIAAPAAQADPWFDGLGDAPVPMTHGVGATLQDYLESQVVRPDDRAAHVSPVAQVAPAVLPDDRAGERGPGSAPAHIVVAAPGFDWTDAGIGAAMAFGLILLGTGGLLVARRHRKPSVAAL